MWGTGGPRDIVFGVKSELLELSYDPLLEEGARNAVRTCLNVQKDERAVLVADRGSLEIAAALAVQLSRAAGEFRSVVLEDMEPRPLLHLPMEMEKTLEWADVSLFTASAQPGDPKGPVCFETPSNYEITVGLGGQPRKLLGSAQVRKRGVVLQHGTLPLVGDIARICDVLVFETEAARDHARARVRQRAATVADALGRDVSWDEAATALARGFAEALNLNFSQVPLTPHEQALSERLRAEKYVTPAWNARL